MTEGSAVTNQRLEAEMGTSERVATISLRPRLGGGIPLRLDLLLRIEELIGAVEDSLDGDTVDAVCIQTASAGTELPGYDLEEVRRLQDEEIIVWSLEAQRVLRRIELFPIPVIAVIREDWLSGAAELALACSHRFVVAGSDGRIGFPQTAIGFVPAWGATVRLPRLAGLSTAVDMLMGGQPCDAEEARRSGLIDGFVGEGELDVRLSRVASEIRAGGWNRTARSVRRRFVDETLPGRKMTIARGARKYLEAKPGQPARRAVLDLLQSSLSLPIEQAFVKEAVAAGSVIQTETARGRMQTETLAQRATRRSPLADDSMYSLGVVGEDETAWELAYALLAANASVLVKSPDSAGVRASLQSIRGRAAWEQDQGLINALQADSRARRTRGTTAYGGFGALDAVAIVPTADEGPERHDQGISELERHVRAGCPVLLHDWGEIGGDLQSSMEHPERLLPLRFSWPLSHFSLMEIAPGSITAQQHIGWAGRLAQRLDVTLVTVSPDGMSPLGRLLAAYFTTALRLHREGQAPAEIDAAATRLGFRAAPLQRIDAIGRTGAQQLLRVYLNSTGRGAQELEHLSGLDKPTFHHYGDGGPAAATGPAGGNDKDGRDDPAERLVLAIINEAAGVLQEGTARSPEDVDMIAIKGIGFPGELGGPLFHAQNRGFIEISDRIRLHSHTDGDPVGLLIDLAVSGKPLFT